MLKGGKESAFMPLPNEQREYTYEDYLTWPENERYEIIDGVVYAQATPSSVHQTISGNLYFQFHSYFQGKQCRVFAAPFTVRLPLENGETDDTKNKNIVEPDLAIVCDKNKLDQGGYNGAPTLIVEIVSPGSKKRDYMIKLHKYEKAGVKEYWIITPETESIIRYALNEQGRYDLPETFALGEDEEIIAKMFPDLIIPLKDIFMMWQ